MAQRPTPTVLLMAAGAVDSAALQQAVSRLREEGGNILLLSHPPVQAPVAGLDGLRAVGAAAADRGPAFRRALRAADRGEKFWLHVRDDQWVVERLNGIEVVVPLDEHAGSAAAHLAEEHSRLVLAEDVDAAVQALRGLGDRPNRTETSPTPLPALGERLQRGLRGARWWARSDEAARAQRASAAAVGLLRQGREAEADRGVRRALEKLSDPRLRADLLGDVVSWALAHGRRPTLSKDAYAAELAVADRHHATGEHQEAAASVVEAMRTAFHPALHFDGPRSPLADDPRGFTAPLRESAVAGVLRGGPQRSDDSAATREDGGRTRLLIATQHNADFLGEIREHFAAHPDFDTRFEMFKDTPAVRRFGRQPAAFVEQVLTGKPGLPRGLEDTFREHLDCADVVLVEWATALAALVSRIDHSDTRVVVRMHSYEAFTMWPHLTDFSNVDDVVFVSDHLRDLAVAAIPGLQSPQAPRLHVIANAMELSRFARPKQREARFTLGVVGASKVVKDPLWAIEVLRELRRHDERFRLLLVRGKLQDDTAAARAYAERLQAALDELGPAVEVLGHTDDVPEVLRRVGVVVSSSVRESFHMGLVEGVASGALPVVRDWPFFPGAARDLFPSDWVVADPAGAAARILSLTATEEAWTQAAGKAAAHVRARWDWPVVRRDFERLFSRPA